MASRLLWQLRAQLKQLVPVPVLNGTLLAMPALYRTSLVNFETNISQDGIRDLLEPLHETLVLPGDVIECGSSRCGASIIMANYMRAHGSVKRIFACDSFEGFDQEELRNERDAGLTTTGERDCRSTSYAYVQRKLLALGLAEIVVPVKGFFAQTLPSLQGPFSLALIDCDLQSSLMFCAETIWPRLQRKGRIVFDDYLDNNFEGARLGVDCFVKKYGEEIEEHGIRRRLYSVRKL